MDLEAAYKGTKVLVTGASGFIGGHLCQRLSELGARVTGVYHRHRPNGDHAEWLHLDLTDLQAVCACMKTVQPAIIFHLAGYAVGRRDLDAVLPAFENNLRTTVNLMTAAQDTGCCTRLVLTNSVEEPERGDPLAVPSSPYAASKFAASAYARMFHALYGLPTVIARVFMVYGPDQKDLNKLVPYVILKAFEGKAPELTSGVRKVDWVYVGDLVDGLIHLGRKRGLEGQTIELGSGVSYSVREVVEEIVQQINPALEPKFGALADRPMEQERVANVAEARAKTEWEPQVSLEDGITRTIAWYRAQLGR